MELIGERPHVSTVHRWAAHGISGVRLRTLFACGCKRTKREWMEEFFNAVATAKVCGRMGLESNVVASRQALKRKSDAEYYLDKEGL